MPMSNRGTRLAVWLIVVLSVLILLGVGYLLLPSTRGVATQQDTVTLQRRQDCAREISSAQNEVKEARDNAGWRALLALGLRNNDAFVRYTEDLSRAIRAVDALEPLQDAVDRECPKV